MTERDFSLRKRWIVLVLAGFILLALFRSAWMPRVLDTFMPAFQSLNAASYRVWGWVSGEDSRAARKQDEFERLVFQNRQYQRRLKAMEVVIAENRALRRSLLLDLPQGYDKVTAEVVFRSASHWFESLQIDKGFEDGLSVNQVVMNASGVIGKISNVTAKTARVQLLSHPEHSVSCVVGKNRVPGVLTGRFQGRPAQLRYLQNYAKIQPGAQVLSSGLGGVYPPDLPLGEVLAVQKDAARPVPDASVQLVALEQRLRFVVVLVPNGENAANEETLETEAQAE